MGKQAYFEVVKVLKSEVINHFGSVGNVAAALNITSQAVSMWPEVVPLVRQYQIERLTNGALVTDTRDDTSKVKSKPLAVDSD